MQQSSRRNGHLLLNTNGENKNMFSLPNGPLATCSSAEACHVHYSPSHWSDFSPSLSLSLSLHPTAAPSLLLRPRFFNPIRSHLFTCSRTRSSPRVLSRQSLLSIPPQHVFLPTRVLPPTCYLYLSLLSPPPSTFHTQTKSILKIRKLREKREGEPGIMERRGGCCIARYGGDADVAWRVGRIMLKYRPIAPKPAAIAPVVPAASDLKSAPSSGRMKRKAPSGTGTGTRLAGKRGRKPKKVNTMPAPTEDREEKCSSSSSSATTTTSVDSSSLVTLPLMPESPEVKPNPSVDQAKETITAVVVPTPIRPVGSWVTVEGLTDVWREEALVMPVMGTDEAPAFVTDGWGRVTWANEAYKNLVTGGGEEGEEVRVGLVTRGLVPAWRTCVGFTCRVRVRYACKRKGRVSLAAPCDVWRVDGGGYAWRLDTKAALSLSPSL